MINNNDAGRRKTGPSTTDWEEHGAAGDLSTGRRLKYVQDVPLAVLIDETEDGDATVTYVGTAKAGVLPAQALWRVMRITEDAGETTIEFAGGEDTFENVWNDRVSLTYV